jgi:hypothetical protein
MILNRDLVEEFERELARRDAPDYRRNLRIFEDMRQLAVKLKALPTADPLEGIDVDIQIARILNARKPA